jgi:hypothetical protein
MSPIPYSSDVFISDSHLSLLRSLGARQIGPTQKEDKEVANVPSTSNLKPCDFDKTFMCNINPGNNTLEVGGSEPNMVEIYHSFILLTSID